VSDTVKLEGIGSDASADLGRSRVRQMRRLAAFRRPAGLLLLAIAPLVILGVDFSRRHARLIELNGKQLEWYLGAIVESFAVWVALLYAGSRRRGRLRWLNAGLFVLCLTFAVGGQT
jgi:hypothetical protein